MTAWVRSDKSSILIREEEVGMAFKNLLQKAIETNGGRTPENLSRIVGLAREIQPDITLRYLSRLLTGHPARPEDYQALGAALGVSPANLIEDEKPKLADNRRKARQFAIERMKRPDMAEDFVMMLETAGKFRNQILAYDDMYVVFNELLQSIYGSDDEDLS